MKHGDAAPRITRRVLLIVLGPSLAYAIAAVDPVMLTLNLSEVGGGLEGSSSTTSTRPTRQREACRPRAPSSR